jgi:DnaJ-class molecular chaperone
MSKGDIPRPISVDSDTFKLNWENTFGSKEEPICDRCQGEGEYRTVWNDQKCRKCNSTGRIKLNL